MDYKTLMGYGDKPKKKKKPIKKPVKKPSITEGLREEFGKLDTSGVELGKIYTDKDRPPFQVNESKVSIGGLKFILSINWSNGLVLNFLPTKMVDDKEKVWNILKKHLQKKLKFTDFDTYKGSSAGFSFKIDKSDIEDWFIKLIK